MVNGKRVNIPSYQLQGRRRRRGARARRKKQLRIQDALQLAEQVGFPTWVEVDAEEVEGHVQGAAATARVCQDINENLVVELYSK